MLDSPTRRIVAGSTTAGCSARAAGFDNDGDDDDEKHPRQSVEGNRSKFRRSHAPSQRHSSFFLRLIAIVGVILFAVAVSHKVKKNAKKSGSFVFFSSMQ